MKKLLLLSALALGLTAQARQLTFYLGNDAIKPGEKVVFAQLTQEPAGAGFDVTMAPELFLHSDIVTSNVTITAECTSGQSIQMCAGGDCMAGATVTKTGVKIGSNDKIALEFEYMDYVTDIEAVPVVTTNFTAVDPKYPDTKVEFTLEMNPKNGTVSISIADPEFNIVGGGINYHFEGATTLDIFDITGRAVMHQALKGDGFVSTADLPRGLYIYRLTGATNASGKFQLK